MTFSAMEGNSAKSVACQKYKIFCMLFKVHKKILFQLVQLNLTFAAKWYNIKHLLSSENFRQADMVVLTEIQFAVFTLDLKWNRCQSRS